LAIGDLHPNPFQHGQEEILMSNPDLTTDTTEVRQRVLSRWENEGGAMTKTAFETNSEVPDLTNAELVHLRMRVIALENLMIAVLAEGSDQQRQLALDMGDYIAPRAGATQHLLTIHASHHMTELVHRSDRFRTSAFATKP
jgi:hypothetical protein